MRARERARRRSEYGGRAERKRPTGHHVQVCVILCEIPRVRRKMGEVFERAEIFASIFLTQRNGGTKEQRNF